MIAHAMVGSSLWSVRRHDFLARKEDIQASVDGSRATAEMNAAGDHVRSLFEAHGLASLRANGDDYHLSEVFTALLGMDDTEALSVLAFVMADTLEAGGAIVEAVAVATETDMAAYWMPEPVFLDLVRDKRAINAMVADIASPSTAKAALTDTGKAQKDLIWNRIAGEGCEANPGWRPGWMQVPPTRLVEAAGSPPADAWARIARLFTSDDGEFSLQDQPAAAQDAA
jgi:ParB family chromosome partitioning protein